MGLTVLIMQKLKLSFSHTEVSRLKKAASLQGTCKQPPDVSRRLYGLASLGPPAFFPLGNAAGCHNAMTKGLNQDKQCLPKRLLMSVRGGRRCLSVTVGISGVDGGGVKQQQPQRVIGESSWFFTFFFCV